MSAKAQGWYRDPYGIHEDRYFSAGRPTKLVRDGERESYDPPPDRPPPPADLIPVEPADTGGSAGTDLRRADEPAEDPPQYRRAVLDYFERLPKR